MFYLSLNESWSCRNQWLTEREGSRNVGLFVRGWDECVYSQRKAGQYNCGNGENCCCRSGVGSWTFPPPQGWPPPILVCWAATQTEHTLLHINTESNEKNELFLLSVCVCESECLAGKQSSYCWWQRGKVGRAWMHGLAMTVTISGRPGGRRPLHFQCAGCHVTLAVLHRNKCQHKCRFYHWTHIYKADNHQKHAVSHSRKTKNTKSFIFFKLIHTKPVDPLLPRSQCSWGESLFGRLRPTHPYYDMSNLFFSCWECGWSVRGKWNKQNGWHETRFSDMKREGRRREGNIRRNRANKISKIYLR